ncbi:hypothetical protein StoSoilB13_28880 (plasmid) [Arthrobacter sp. StoSoilB13]|nr:hypothetical protein StoSoilB13_28880 [Arthrobacter sp. StoSoilB13]
MVPGLKALRFKGVAAQFPELLTLMVWVTGRAPVPVTVKVTEDKASAVPLTGTAVTFPL